MMGGGVLCGGGVGEDPAWEAGAASGAEAGGATFAAAGTDSDGGPADDGTSAGSAAGWGGALATGRDSGGGGDPKRKPGAPTMARYGLLWAAGKYSGASEVGAEIPTAGSSDKTRRKPARRAPTGRGFCAR